MKKIRSEHPLKGYARIEVSKKDGKPLFVFNSLQDFYINNPDIIMQDENYYKIVDRFEEEENPTQEYDSNNICSFCDGEVWFYHPDPPYSPHVKCICEDGTRVGELKHEIEMERRWKIQSQKEYCELRDYIKSTSTCKTCGGDQGMTLGLMTCPECGLPGNCPWPG